MWEPLQDFAAQTVGRWGRASGVGSSRPGEHHRVYITAHSPRPHPGWPGSSHPPTGTFVQGSQGLFWPKHHPLPAQTAHPHTTCVLGRSGSQLVGAHLGRWSTENTAQARIDPSREALASQSRHPFSAMSSLRGTFLQPGNPLAVKPNAALPRYAALRRARLGPWVHWIHCQSEGISAREDAEKDLHPHRTIARLG